MLSVPAATRCPQCFYLPPSATVICPLCHHDLREPELHPASNSPKEDDMSRASKVPVLPLLLLLAGCATAQVAEDAIRVPENLKPGPKEYLSMILPAGGVQIYECRARKDGEYEWAFIAPEADLYDAHGAKVGHHFAGPHWESGDGSRIVGTVKERADAPAAGAIPWLLLSAKSVGPDGSLSQVTSVQRLRTSGGMAPKEGCSQATAGAQARVDYTADYYFFTPNRPLTSRSRDFDYVD